MKNDTVPDAEFRRALTAFFWWTAWATVTERPGSDITYGMLGIGLVLFCLRGLKPDLIWSERLLKTSFWSFNIGLALMGVMTLLPIGTLQLLAAIDHGYWYARSAEFMQQPIIDFLVWIRVPGDIVFSFGALTLAWFVLGLWIRPRYETASLSSAPQELPHA